MTVTAGSGQSNEDHMAASRWPSSGAAELNVKEILVAAAVVGMFLVLAWFTGTGDLARALGE